MKLNKKILISIVIAIVIIVVLAIVLISQKDNIKKITEKLNKEEETITDGITCKVYDNQTEKLKSLVIISRVNGIKEVEYQGNNNKTIKLNCNDRKQVGIDLEIEINKEYTFKVISNEEEKTEKIQLDENYIDDYIKITKLEDDDVLKYSQVNIQFNNLTETTTKKQYRIDDSNWKNCTNFNNLINLDIEHMHINKRLNNEKEITIFTRIVDKAGNIVQTSKNIDMSQVLLQADEYKIFSSMNKLGYTNLNNYGIGKVVWSNIESDWNWFRVGYIGGGHYSGETGYSMEVRLNCYNLKIPYDAIKIVFEYWIDSGGGSYSQAGIVINYSDGTTTRKNTNAYYSGSSRIALQQSINREKEISNIRFKIWGYDGHTTSSWGRINNISFVR